MKRRILILVLRMVLLPTPAAAHDIPVTAHVITES